MRHTPKPHCMKKTSAPLKSSQKLFAAVADSQGDGFALTKASSLTTRSMSAV